MSELHGCKEVAEQWVGWCGENRWTNLLDALGVLNGKMIWYGGYPQSKSAIPLCFTLVLENGIEINGSRLKDIQRAIDVTCFYRQMNHIEMKIETILKEEK